MLGLMLSSVCLSELSKGGFIFTGWGTFLHGSTTVALFVATEMFYSNRAEKVSLLAYRTAHLETIKTHVD